MNDPEGIAPEASNGYETVASDFMALRTGSTVGVSTVRRWARGLPRGGTVLDLGCGHGVPISLTLFQEGLAVSGVDASPALLSAFRAHFPRAPAECCEVQDSGFLENQYDGVIAWGLIFLLQEEVQEAVIRKVGRALRPGGRFLFTAPRQACEWADSLTGQTSRSLGAEAYRALVEAANLILEGETDDEGKNHYFLVRKPE